MNQALAVLSIEPTGIWLNVYGKKYFLAFRYYPSFIVAPVASLFNIEPLGDEGFRWPDLDVDLNIVNVQVPELYPLISPATPVLPVLIEASIVLHDGDEFRALRWMQSPAFALGGIRPVDFQDSPEHIQAILDLIGRIEHGVWS